ncbi:MAG: tetratricopeptide repeat protein [Granulosicoccaceae bacterium]
MKPNLLTLIALSLALQGCATVTKSAVSEDASNSQDYEAQGELMYQMLVAEMAGRRGRVDLAMDGYLKASRSIDDPRLAERAARLAVYAKAWDSALEAGQRWVDLEPDNINAHRLLVGVHLKHEDVKATADTYERILELTSQPFDEGAGSVLTSLAREPQLPLAVKVAQELSSRHPKSAMGHFLVARLAAAAQMNDTAIDAFDRTLELEPDLGRANLYRAQLKSSMGHTDEALSDLHAYLKRKPDDIPSQLGLANLLVDVGRHAEAEAHANTLFQRYPDNGEVVFEIGLMAIDSKRFDAAQTYLKRSVELLYKTSEAHYFIGRVAQTRREYAEAMSAYDQVSDGQYQLDAGIRAAELSATSESLEVGLARLSSLSGQFATEDSARRLALAEANILQSAGEQKQALEVLNRALEAQPSDRDIRYARGLAAEQAGDSLLFEADMQALVKQDPNNAHAMNALGYSLAERGERLEEAKQLIERAYQIKPDDPAIIDSMGWVHFKLGDYPAAIEHLRRAYELMRDPEIAAHLGEVLWLAGEREEAQQLLEAALDESPGDDRLRAVQRKFKP